MHRDPLNLVFDSDERVYMPSYFHAEIKKCGKVVHRLAGKYNSREDLAQFLLTNWGGQMRVESVEWWQVPIELEIREYVGGRLFKIRDITIPEPIEVPEDTEFELLMREVEVL